MGWGPEYPGIGRSPLDLAHADSGRSHDDMTLKEMWELHRLLAATRNVKNSRKILVKIHQRLALPFACTIFGVLGSAVSLRLPRDQRRVGFALTLAIVFLYYALSVVGVAMAQLGVLPPAAGAWLPNGVGVTASAILLVPERC